MAAAQERQVRIVIADDDPIARMDLRERLMAMGYLVVGEAADGVSAVSLTRKMRPDLIIIDIRMPDLDGIEAARILTAANLAPVLLLSAYSEPELVQRATQAGVINYMVKPYGEAQLGPAIDIALSRFREFQQVRSELGTVRNALEARKVIERAKGRLMEQYGLSEAEAFRRIQKRSMDSGKSMREVAEAILLADEMSQGAGSATPWRT